MSKTAKVIENSIIAILHLALLGWILFILYEAGVMEISKMFMHFVGMSLYGAFLIRGTAWITNRRHQQGLQ